MFVVCFREEDTLEYHYPEVPCLFPGGKSPVLQRPSAALGGGTDYQEINSFDTPDYCPPPDVSSSHSPQDRPKIPSPSPSRRPVSVAGNLRYPCPPQRSQSALSLQPPKSSKPLPVPRLQRSPECNSGDWYDNDDDNVPASTPRYQNRLRDGAKMSVGSLGLEERHLHQTPMIGQRNPVAQARLIEPIQATPPKAARLPGKIAISHPMPFPYSSQDQSAKFSKPNVAVKPQISQPVPYPRPSVPAPPTRPPRKPALSPKPSLTVPPVQKAFTEPRGFPNKEFGRKFKDELSRSLPLQSKISLSGNLLYAIFMIEIYLFSVHFP